MCSSPNLFGCKRLRRYCRLAERHWMKCSDEIRFFKVTTRYEPKWQGPTNRTGDHKPWSLPSTLRKVNVSSFNRTLCPCKRLSPLSTPSHHVVPEEIFSESDLLPNVSETSPLRLVVRDNTSDSLPCATRMRWAAQLLGLCGSTQEEIGNIGPVLGHSIQSGLSRDSTGSTLHSGKASVALCYQGIQCLLPLLHIRT